MCRRSEASERSRPTPQKSPNFIGAFFIIFAQIKKQIMTTLIEGELAPVFSGVDQNGQPISLNDYKGKKVVLYFYPKDDTPGCTKEACSFRDNYEDLLSKGFQVIGISCDSEKAHKKFIEKYNLPFPLISDVDKTIVEQYGVWGKKKFMGKEYMGIFRTTFVINETGLLSKIITKVDVENSTQQLLKEMGV